MTSSPHHDQHPEPILPEPGIVRMNVRSPGDTGAPTVVGVHLHGTHVQVEIGAPEPLGWMNVRVTAGGETVCDGRVAAHE